MLPSPSNECFQEIVVHDHVLPSGWKCRYDPATCKYTFIHEHLSASEQLKCGTHRWESKLSTPRSSPSRMSPGPSGARASVPFRGRAEANASRISQQFPSVDEAHIDALLKLYNNRENLVISALLSEGHTRSTFILDESLFYKIKAAFPNVEPDIIRRLLIKNENKEHNTIASVLGHFGLFNTTRYEYSKYPQLKLKYLKLKYLKFAYPHVDEIILLDLLFNNDQDVNKVIDHLTKIGYHSSELKVKISKISESAIVKNAHEKLNATRPDSLPFARHKYHPNLEEQEIIRRQLCEIFPSIDITLINASLEAAGFDIDLAQKLCIEMTPHDSDSFFVRTLPDKSFPEVKTRTSRGVQTNELFQDLFGTPLELHEKEEEDAFVRDVASKEDKSTFTKEDGVITKVIAIRAKGPIQAKGPMVRENVPRAIPQGPTVVPNGPDPSLWEGPQKFESEKTISKGPQKENRKGPSSIRVVRIKEGYSSEGDIDNIDNDMDSVYSSIFF